MDFSTLSQAPSGAFVHNPQDLLGKTYQSTIASGSLLPDYYIFNIGILEPAEAKTEFIAADVSLSFFRSNSLRIVQSSAVENYSDILLKIAADAVRSEYTAFLCPLRGAYKPSMLVQLMTNHRIQFEDFPFTNHEDSSTLKKIEDHLYSILDQKLNNITAPRIFILDTAKGGQGTQRLARLFRDYCNDRKRFLHADFNLLVSRSGYNHSNISSAKSLNSDRFTLNIELHQVDDLIVEDWDAALGIQVSDKNDRGFLKPSVFPGAYVYYDSTGFYKIETNDLSRSIDGHFAKAITDNLNTHDLYSQVGSVWEYYLNKS